MQACRFDFAYGSAPREGYLFEFHRPNIFQATSRFRCAPAGHCFRPLGSLAADDDSAEAKVHVGKRNSKLGAKRGLHPKLLGLIVKHYNSGGSNLELLVGRVDLRVCRKSDRDQYITKIILLIVGLDTDFDTHPATQSYSTSGGYFYEGLTRNRFNL